MSSVDAQDQTSPGRAHDRQIACRTRRNRSRGSAGSIRRRCLLDAATEIESLQERLGAVEKASHDRGRLETYQQDAEHQARRILRELARPIDLDEAETLRLRVDEPIVIRGLGQRFAELRGQAEEARKTIGRHEDQIKRQESELADLEPTRSTSNRCAGLSARLARLATSTRDLAELRNQFARAEKERRPRWPGFPAGVVRPKT